MSALTGARVVVTRAEQQARSLGLRLEALGAKPIYLPLISIAPPADPRPLADAAARFSDYHLVIFTSANAVEALAAALGERSGQENVRAAAVGKATAAAARDHGFTVVDTPERYTAEDLAEQLCRESLIGQSVLIPASDITRDVLATRLREAGASVDVVEAYRNVQPPEAAAQARKIFREPFPDWVTFASPSAVNALVQIVGVDRVRACKLAAIGPVTNDALQSHGLAAAALAHEHSVDGLISALLSH